MMSQRAFSVLILPLETKATKRVSTTTTTKHWSIDTPIYQFPWHSLTQPQRQGRSIGEMWMVAYSSTCINQKSIVSSSHLQASFSIISFFFFFFSFCWRHNWLHILECAQIAATFLPHFTQKLHLGPLLKSKEVNSLRNNKLWWTSGWPEKWGSGKECSSSEQ